MEDPLAAAGAAVDALSVTPIAILPSSPIIYALPNELLLIIAEKLESSSLENLAAASRRLHAIVTRTRFRDTRMGSIHEYNPSNMNEWQEIRDFDCEPVLHGSIAQLYEILETSWLPIGQWIIRLDVEVLDEQRIAFPWASMTQETPHRLYYAHLVGKILYLLPGLRELIIDMAHRNLVAPRRSSLHSLFGCDEESLVGDLPRITAFRNLQSLDWRTQDLPAVIACLPTLERLSLAPGCVMPETFEWKTEPKVKWLQLDLSSSALIIDTDSPEWDSANDHLFNFIRNCTSLKKLDIEISHLWHPVSFHVKYAHAFVKSLAVAAPGLKSLQIMANSSCFKILDHILPVHGALRYFEQLKHLSIPQEILFGTMQLPTEINHRFASVVLLDSLESLEIQCPYGSVFHFLGCLSLEHQLYLSALNKVTISCSGNRGIRFADKNGRSGMLQLWNRSAIVKELCNSSLCLSVRYDDYYAPAEALKDMYEQEALALARFVMSLGPEMSAEVCFIIAFARCITELVQAPLKIRNSKGFVCWRAVEG